ncbi:autotransporter domain-containing protein [Sebaldella sp. S0638]|uniref:autotransporter domain-containing protein n=1 Tax=Sebaldella sp. S0638 TaxID=2957809 RepID=UPI0020A1E27F|nr:autotransporter domain-containing protein [Sebaldella sp. S0638]MCP1225151.1 autotransporter domain-containing protein [Sebaldella sp. S0638]
MKRNKKLLVSFAALNAMIPAYVAGQTTSVVKYDRLYNSMINNIKTGKSNDKAYQLLERTLNQKNKELEDLYFQGDYIVKPEYLEWQIFFSGFYHESEGNDNTSENARYHSKVEYGTSGYYNENGEYIITGTNKSVTGKPYQPLQTAKEIDLGVSIPMKGITRDPSLLNPVPPVEINVNPGTLNVTPPSAANIPTVNTLVFQPMTPTVESPSLTSVPVITVKGAGGGNSDGAYFVQGGSSHAVISQWDMITGDINIRATGFQNYSYTMNNATGTISLSGARTSPSSATVPGAYTSAALPSSLITQSSVSMQGFYRIVGAPVVRLGAGVTFTLEGDNSSLAMSQHILHYDAHSEQASTLDWLETNGRISTAEKSELSKYVSNTNSDLIQYVVNEGKMNLVGRDVLAVNQQGHTYSGDKPVSVFSNKGEITGLNDLTTSGYTSMRQTVFAFLESGNPPGREQIFDNTGTGKIELRAPESIVYNIGGNYDKVHAATFMNSGSIKMYGLKNVGVYTAGAYSGYSSAAGLAKPGRIVFDTPIEILGDQSIGIDLERPINGAESKINLKIGGEGNLYSGNAGAGYDPQLVEESTGLYYKLTAGGANTLVTLDDYLINADSYSKRSYLVRVEDGTLTLGDGNSTNNSGKNQLIESDGGNENILLAAIGKSAKLVTDKDIQVNAVNGIRQTGLYVGDFTTTPSNGGGTMTFAGKLNVSGDASKGVVVDKAGTSSATGASITNSGMINISGGSYYDAAISKTVGTVGVIVNGQYSKFTSSGIGSTVKIDVADKESTAVFVSDGLADISNGDIKTSNGAFNLYSKGNTAVIKLTDTLLETGQKSLLFYSESNGKFDLNNVTAKIKGGTNASDRGTAFYYQGTGGTISSAAIEAYIKNMLNNTQGQLTLDMEAGSRLFVMDNVTMDLSSAAGAIGSLGINFTPSSTDYKTYMMYKSSLGIDQNIDLDSSSDAYNSLEIATSSITNNGKSIVGNLAGNVAIAQENGLDASGTPLGRNMVTLTNDAGTITLGGADSVGMYTSYGEIYNKNIAKINVTGDNSIGIYAVNGSKVENQAGSEITVGKGGTGIFAEGYKQGTAQLFGDGKLDIKNSGLIKSGTGSGAIGIFLNNNSGVARSDSKLDLTNGVINLKDSENAVGVYVEKGTVTDSASTITVGKNGIALYAKDSDVTLSGTTINLFGDNALGLYLDSPSSFNGTGTINIDGQNVVLFNIISSGGTITNNFTLGSIASGSTYSIGNISGGEIEYTGSTTLGTNGTMMAGINSAIYLNGSAITAAPGAVNTAAMALGGQYGGVVSFPTMSLSTDGENAGTITLGDSSVGIYGKNGSRLSNKGTITMGTGSAAISTAGAGSTAVNSGQINLGAGSQGIYLRDGDKINNTLSGKIESTGESAIGIFGNNVNTSIENHGLIDLTGSKTIGIYTAGATAKTVTNSASGVINIGNSVSQDEPGVGIFSQTSGDNITNAGTITGGTNTIGIFSQNAAVTNSGNISTGAGGTAIYADGGTLNLTGGTITTGGDGSVGVYASDLSAPVVNNSAFVIGSGTGDNNAYGFVFSGTAPVDFTNNASVTMDNNGVFLYSKTGGTVTNNANITMNGSNNVGYYVEQAGTIVNNAVIKGDTGSANIGIFGKGIYDSSGNLITEGSIKNTGDILLGDSHLVELTDEYGEKYKSGYSVGIYGEGSSILNDTTATIKVGKDGIGMYARDAVTASVNYGNIIGTGDNSIGIFADNTKVENYGTIDMSGDNVIGIAVRDGAELINKGTIKVTGDNVFGIYMSGDNTVVRNEGTIVISGTGFGIGYTPSADKNNIYDTTGTSTGSTSKYYELPEMPTLVNSGIINIDLGSSFNYDGVKVIVKVDPSTNTPTTDSSSQVGFGGTIPDKFEITPDFSQGTSADRYVLENIFRGQSGRGEYISQSLTWDATAQGSDMVMTRKSYTDFTDGLWYEDFGRVLNENYANSTGDRLKIYDKIDYITTEKDFRHVMGSLAGDVYANINQREDDIARAFENSLDLMSNSVNNTKENVKINVIAGKGKHKEDTDGVLGYDYTTTGVLALREVERTYRHTFGYSLGYLHTGFEFKDGNESEEWVDTVQLGIHNKYNAGGWKVRNDLTGRVSLHNVDRNIDWPSPNTRSEMNGTYETYSVTSDNILGKEFEIGKKVTVTPYGAFRAMYVTRPTFKESGLERLEVEGNDAWSVKPRAGVELKGAVPLGSQNSWQLKGSLDVAYEYELADLNEREKARLVAVESDYHKLSKPEEEKGTFRTKASIGVEVEDRYGIFLTGEYAKGNDKEDDYRAGITLKAVF